jgi:tRNA-dihydrouridine synthase A
MGAAAKPGRRLSVAPMMDRTDRHCRYFLRLITARTLLYTEMVTTGAILFGDRDRYLAFDASEHPVALQVGGADPGDLAACAAIGAEYGYEEINLNIGCPSDRVQRARFGACLMAEPSLVAECVVAMRAATHVPVTVKCRIGIDDQDSYGDLRAFVDPLAEAGCTTFIVHARKAHLQGLSPKENRDVPPLRYAFVYRLKDERPDLEIIINGGIAFLVEAQAHLAHVDGVMLGRAAYHDPYMLAEADRLFFGGDDAPPRREVLEAYTGYVEENLAAGVRLPTLTRHILGLFHGQPGARAWRRHIAENAHRPGAGIDVIWAAADHVGGARTTPHSKEQSQDAGLSV